MIFSLIVLTLMVISPIISVMAVLLKRTEMKQAVSWPRVNGEVTAVRLLENRKQFHPEVDVSYSVNDQSFTSRQRPVSQSGQATGSKAWAREFSLQYKPGTAVALFYDPKRPRRATLNPALLQPNPTRWQLTSSGTILLALGMHLVGARALLTNYLNLSGSSVIVIVVISTIITFLLGAAFGLLLGEERQTSA